MKTKLAWLESRYCSYGSILFLSVVMKDPSKLTGYFIWLVGWKVSIFKNRRANSCKKRMPPMLMQLISPRPEKILALRLSWASFGPWVGYYCVLKKAWPSAIFALLKAEIPKFNDSKKVFPFKILKHRWTREDLGIFIRDENDIDCFSIIGKLPLK